MRPTLFGTLAGSAGADPIALVAAAHGAASDTSNATTSAIDTTGATLLVLAVADYIAGLSVSDSKTNTYTTLTIHGVGQTKSVLYYCKNPVVGGSHTFSVNAPAGYPSISAAAFNNTDTTANADQENGAFAGAVGTLATGSVTPSTDNQVIIAGLAHYLAAGDPTINGGFTIATNQPNVVGQAVGSTIAYLVQTTATAANPTWTAAGAEIAASIATFKHS